MLNKIFNIGEKIVFRKQDLETACSKKSQTTLRKKKTHNRYEL